MNVGGELDLVFELYFVEWCMIGVVCDWNDVVVYSDVVIMVMFGGGLLFDVDVVWLGIYLICVGVDIVGKCELLFGVLECVCIVVDDYD